MDGIKKAACVFLVFLGGGICFVNLSALMFGGPPHYEVGWEKVAISIGLSIMFGYFACKETTT